MTTIKLLLFSLAILWLQTTPLVAQQKHGTLKGLALNTANGETIPYTNVVLKNSTGEVIAGGISNADGLFKISPIAEGTYTVEASFIGFAKEIFEHVKIMDGKETTLTILFTSETDSLPECVIVGERHAISSFIICSLPFTKQNSRALAVRKVIPTHPGLEKDSISIYPNPSSGELNIRAGQDFDRLIITKMNGQVVAEVRAERFMQVSTNLQHLAPAIYVVHFIKGNQRVSKLWVLAH